MTYTAKEIFYTLQGEGVHTGRAAVFLRFAGCNLWTGREQDRASAVCNFCDTDFVGVGPDGGKFETADALAERVAQCWKSGLEGWRAGGPEGSAVPHQPTSPPALQPFVVCTGGEPLLQLDEPLIDALHARGFEVAVETNGTQPAPNGLDWICVSPKSDAPLVLTRGDELKLVYPQAKAPPEKFSGLDFKNFSLQPMDGPNLAANTAAATDYCLAHPQWRLSLQTHKLLGLR
ncbi:MAG TPA: 7-carboxy-7-deazaguanine synthase [Gemmatimonadaceae bacterium]|nr:7-carboxy-7-deazaguanine synthase [Gemmatimonadaceae bacterium]